MTKSRVFAIAVLVFCTAGNVTQGSEGWVTYDAPDYGFSMLVPEGTKMAEKEYKGGWGQLWAEHEGVTLYGLAKKGVKATPEEIEKVGVELTGIPADSWKEIGRGEGKSGWIWYRTVEASKGGKLVIGDYGVGKTASYLLVLVTTEADYRENKADYQTWYESIKLK